MAKLKTSKIKKAVESVSSDDETQIVIFDESSYGIRKVKPNTVRKRGNLEKIDLDTSGVVPAEKQSTMDADDIADLEASELWDRLKNTVEDVAASSLSGKEKKKYMLEKTVRLSGVELPKPKTPFRILKGMREKAKKREKWEKEQGRVMDSVLPLKSSRVAIATRAKQSKRK